MQVRNIFFLGLLFLFGCKVSDREVFLPSYVHVAKPVFKTPSDNSQGFPSAAINDLWVFDNEIVRGLHVIGANVPIQKVGNTKIRLTAAVKSDGNLEKRVIYPMYTSFSKEVDLVQLETDTVEASFTYLGNTIFPFIEDFDGNGSRFEYNPALKQVGDTIIKDKGVGAFSPGNFAGRIELKSTDAKGILEVYSQVYTNWPRFTPFYFEMDYKGNIPITVGLYATNASGETKQFPMFITNPIAQWNKLYLNLEPEINSRGTGMQYRLFMRFSKGSVANPEAWIDNLKIVYLD